MSTTTTLILGAGFGGITAANTLRALLPAEHEIVVVDQSSRFYVGAGKTWIMLGERTFEDVSQSRTALLAPGIRYIETSVQSIALADRTVTTGSGTLRWDYLVVALGADLNLAKIPGLAEAAHTFYTVDGAQRLKGELERFTGGDIAVLIARAPFKCPPAPYEAALLLQHALEKRGLAGKVRLAMYTPEGAPMATAGPEMGQYIKAELAQRSIAYHPQKVVTRVDGAARRMVFENGSDAKYDLLIAIPPHEAPKVVRDAGLTNAGGWIPVDPKTLQVQGAPEASTVYAVGDVTTVPLPGRYKPDVGLVLPKAGVFAEAHGRIAAQHIAARILGRTADASFDGVGFCYLEMGGGRAVRADGSFFAMPHPAMQKRSPDEAQFRDKLDWVSGMLRPPR
jgi:sulfide:quinone oxidoreductase